MVVTGGGSPTYQICNLIFFPLSSTVLILKSTPANKTNESEAKNKDAIFHKKESYSFVPFVSLSVKQKT